MKMNNYLIILAILFIILLFSVYYYKYLKKKNFESFFNQSEKKLKLKLRGKDEYIAYECLENNAKHEKIVEDTPYKGKTSFNKNNQDCVNNIIQFRYLISKNDYNILKNSGVNDIKVKIKYKVNDKSINKTYIIPISQD